MNENDILQSEEFKLTEKQKIFCREYIWDWNGSRAYKAAYKGVTDGTARANASDLLTKTNIKEYIQYLKDNLAEVVEISPSMVLTEHRKIAFSSIAHLHNTWITLKEFEDLTDDQKACIQEIDTKIKTEYRYSEEDKKRMPIEVEYIKIKLYDKTRSLDSINKMLGWDAPKKIDLSNIDGTLNLSKYTPEQLHQMAEDARILEKKK